MNQSQIEIQSLRIIKGVSAMKQKNTIKSGMLNSALAMGACLGSGCDFNHKSTINTPVTLVNRPPVVQQIPRQEVNEGSLYTIDLGQYVSDPDGDPITVSKTAGVGNIENNTFTYQDVRDLDRTNNEYQIQFEAADGKGEKTRGSFTVMQRDTFSRNSPQFFTPNRLWVAYAPTNFNPLTGQYPNEASIRSDLETLVNINAYGIVTYGSENNLGQIPRIAREAGIQKVVMGIWDPHSQEELTNALAAQAYVDGYCVGNEGLNSRYTIAALETTINHLRNQTNKPVTTTEVMENYSDQQLLDLGDWTFPNAHPFWHGIRDPATAVQWTLDQHSSISERSLLPVVFKEVGLPSEGEQGLSEGNQNAYYRELETRLLNSSHTKTVHFEAFDQPWKNNPPVEPHWGFFTSNRTPKTVARPQVLHTFVPSYGSFDNLTGRVVNVKPQNYRISTYVYAVGSWWMKPTFANPLTQITPNGNWITDVTTGGVDQFATPINSYLVVPTYVPVHPVLPVVDGINVIHGISSERPR